MESARKACVWGEVKLDFIVIFVINLFLLLFVVPQDGCLAAVYMLLAFNHCACLRNARRIS